MAWEQQALLGEVVEAKLALVLGLFWFVILEFSPTPPSESGYTRDNRQLLLIGYNLPW